MIDLLAYLEPELWPKNPVSHKIRKLQIKHESPTDGFLG